MARIAELVPGAKFGRLTVICAPARGDKLVDVRCECGTVKRVWYGNLGRDIFACGAGIHRAGENGANWRGGKMRHPLRDIWKAMLARCTNPRNARWDDYGGRGITVCDAWRNDFWQFVADMGERPPGYVLDRIDNDGNYEPGNIRWATISVSNKNKRPPRHLRERDARGWLK